METNENILFPNPCTYVKESTSKIIPLMEHVKLSENNILISLSELIAFLNGSK